MGTKAPLREWLDACPSELVIREDDGSEIAITIGVDALESAIAHVVAKARKGPPNRAYTMSSGWGPHGVVTAVRSPGSRDQKVPLTSAQKAARARIRLAYQTVARSGGTAILRGTDDRYLTLRQAYAPEGDVDYQMTLYDRDGLSRHEQGRSFPTLYRHVAQHLETDELTLSFER